MIRAKIPMCPTCGAETKYTPIISITKGMPCLESHEWTCSSCQHKSTEPDYGYYAPNIRKVMYQMVIAAEACERNPSVKVYPLELREWVDLLKGDK